MADPPLTVLLTNDDGVAAPALDLVAEALAHAGMEVRVVAPSHEFTGCGASIGHMSEGAVVPTASVVLSRSGLTALSIDGPPALAVLAGLSDDLGVRPDVVVSGINNGYNTGRVILHSGTLGAALTAGAAGVRAMAVSTRRDAVHGFATGAEFIARTLPRFVAHEAAGTVANVNVPDLPPERLAGAVETSLSDQSQVSLVVEVEDRAVVLRRVALDAPVELVASDVGALEARRISVTRVHPGVYALPPRKEHTWLN